MSEWRLASLGSVCKQVLTGGTPLTSVPEYYENGTVPWLKTKEVNFNRITRTESYISDLGVTHSSAKLIPPHSVIMAMYGQGDTAGRVAVNQIPLATNQACCNLVIDEATADYRFIYFYLKNSYEELVQRKTGSAQPNLNTKLIKSFEIRIPDLPEQRAIADVLSSLDDKIDLLHRQNKTLEAMAETLFRQWFVEEAGADWEERQITDLFEVRDGTHDSPKQAAIGKPLVTSKHIVNGQLDIRNTYLISEDDFAKVNQRSQVDSGDILFSMIGTIGLIYLEQSSHVEYAIKNIGLFKTSQNQIWVFYTYLWLMSPLGRQFIDSRRSGSTQEYISLASLRSITFHCPPIETLHKFNHLVSEYFSKIHLNRSQIRTLETLRDTLLPKLMSGEVRVSAP